MPPTTKANPIIRFIKKGALVQNWIRLIVKLYGVVELFSEYESRSRRREESPIFPFQKEPEIPRVGCYRGRLLAAGPLERLDGSSCIASSGSGTPKFGVPSAFQVNFCARVVRPL